MVALIGSNLFGNKFNNQLYGTGGNDLLAGLGGNDTLVGYDGNDTAWYSGLIKDYVIGTTWGYLTLTDRNAADGDDGSDRLSGIETLAFGNGGLRVGNGEILVNTTTASDQYQPSVAALADGGYVLAWQSYGQESNGWGIYGQRFDTQGYPAGGELHLNTTTASDQSDPVIAALADGGYVAAWVSWGQDGEGSGVYAQRYDGGGAPAGGEFQVNVVTAGSQYTPSITGLADGGFVVGWQSPDGNGAGVFARRFDASGNPLGSEFRINSFTTSDQYAPALAALQDGGLVATWTSWSQDGSYSGVYCQRYDVSGNLVGGEFRVNTYTTQAQSQPAVAALAYGGFVVTWESYGQDGQGSGVYGQRYNAAGQAVGAEFRINTATSGDQLGSTVAGLADGGFVVIWQSYGSSSYIDVYAQRYDYYGGSVGEAFRVSSGTATAYSPSVTALEDGGFVVAWGHLASGSGYDVHAQRYDAGGHAVGFSITGTAGNDSLTVGEQSLLTVDGAAGNDTLNGGPADDNLLGGAGNDSLIGGNGDDRLDGGAGNDVLNGGNGSDVYLVDSLSDSITDTGSSGSDTVQSSVTFTLAATLENLSLTGSANINAVGNAGGNFLQGNGGNNILDGKAGGDLLAGGRGDDTYVVDSLFDLVAENSGEGADSVQSAVDFTLPANVETLTLTGAVAASGTGNGSANIIEGNALANTLSGGDGNDTLRGMAGNDSLNGGNGNDSLVGGAGSDVLYGGSGMDSFRFDVAPSASNRDVVLDFSTGFDQIVLALPVFSALGGPGALSASDFAAGTGFANTDTHHVLYNSETGALYYNPDGAGAAAPILVATLEDGPTLNASDFLLV